MSTAPSACEAGPLSSRDLGARSRTLVGRVGALVATVPRGLLEAAAGLRAVGLRAVGLRAIRLPAGVGAARAGGAGPGGGEAGDEAGGSRALEGTSVTKPLPAGVPPSWERAAAPARSPPAEMVRASPEPGSPDSKAPAPRAARTAARMACASRAGAA